MKFQDKLKKCSKEQLWREYCGFLDLSMDEYMYIQRRLMEEQLRIWRASPLGRELLHGAEPESFDELRELLPMTTYEDYAETLLPKRAERLPGEPIVWIQTTWEGGLRPVKLAPYTREMLDVYRHNLLAAMMMATSEKSGDFDLKRGDRILYGGAELPYATGLMPTLFSEDIKFTWLPDSASCAGLSFSQRIKKGFSMALSGGVDFFFGIGSVANYITESFGSSSGGHGGSMGVSLPVALRYIKARYISRRDGRAITPGDIFRLKALFYAGTDAACYKERLTRAWGVEPVELAAGTESTCIGAEPGDHSSMVFFPDACFYEFIPEAELRRGLRDEDYQPRTCLMDEIRAGENYELVISVLHGGAFMRYRIGDVYHCVSAGGALPRLRYVDRIPTVIDIAGFTRITESSMREVISLSRLNLGDWLLKKEFSAGNNPFLHLYVEIPPDAQENDVTVKSVLREHLSLYFKCFDSDYGDLKKLLNMEPLEITILKFGSIAAYEHSIGERLERINPGDLDICGLLRQQDKPYSTTEGRRKV